MSQKCVFSYNFVKSIFKPSHSPVQYQTEFERRDIAAGQIQRFWKNHRNRKEINLKLKALLEQQKNEFVIKRSTPLFEDREKIRQRLIKNKQPPKSARVPKQTRFLEPNSGGKTSRPYNPATDDPPMKFSARIQSSRKQKSEKFEVIAKNPEKFEVYTPKLPSNNKENCLPKPVDMSANSLPNVTDNKVDDQLR